jgi:pilus assembly protein CpaF
MLSDPQGVERRIFDALLRLGIRQPLMDASAVEEIICNGPHRAFVIEKGRKRLIPGLYFDDDEDLRNLVKRLIGPMGRRLDESSPMVDARLPDGSRLNVAIPPSTTRWCCVTIRKFLLRAQSLDQLVGLGTLTQNACDCLDASVQAGVNILELWTGLRVQLCAGRHGGDSTAKPRSGRPIHQLRPASHERRLRNLRDGLGLRDGTP